MSVGLAANLSCDFAETVDIDVGASICETAEDLNARVVVMLSRRSTQNLMQNMLFGSSVTHCVRPFHLHPLCILSVSVSTLL